MSPQSEESPDLPKTDAGSTPDYFDPDTDLPGAVFMIPNRHWGFSVVSADDHPGACVHYLPLRSDGVLVSGTDAEHVRRNGYFYIDPSEENGLRKVTAFKLVPRYFRLHKLKLYFPERLLGRLDGKTLGDLRYELARLNPEE